MAYSHVARMHTYHPELKLLDDYILFDAVHVGTKDDYCIQWGARAVKGRWELMYSNLDLPRREYLQKFYDHCTRKKRYWLYDLFYVIEPWAQDYFVLGNTAEPKEEASEVLFTFSPNWDVKVLAIAGRKKFTTYSTDKKVNEFKLWRILTSDSYTINCR